MTIEERFSATNSVKSQLASIVSDLEHMTSGNFMHHRASAKLLAGCALKNIDKIVAEERERCIKAAQDWCCFDCGAQQKCKIDSEEVGHPAFGGKCMDRVKIRKAVEGVVN